MKKAIFISAFSLISISAFAQIDTVDLDQATIVDKNRLQKIQTQSIITLQDSILKRNQPSLTNLLKFNSTLYFKENGAGMVSSPSFRGTTASQTIVTWNGININSQTTGQTDFNTINIRGFDQVNIKAGSGNVAEQNNAIGGNIELINQLNFTKKFTNELLLRYGSFNTWDGNVNSKYANGNFSFNLNLSRNSSDNDYELYTEKGRKNANGQFYNNNLSLAVGQKLNPKNILRFYGNLFQADRHLSVITPYATKSSYEDFNTRSLLDWESKFSQFQSNFKVAYLTERYKYFPNIEKDYYELTKVNTTLLKHNLKYFFTEKINLNTQLEFIHNQGFAGNLMDETSRNVGSASVSIKHQLAPKFFYEASIRQEFSEQYGNPTLYSLGGKWNLTKFYQFKFNTSKNFRAPTYNDLYTPGVGNLDLKPENSYQFEIGNEFKFKSFELSVNAYYNQVEDLIRWIPNINPLGGTLWQPENVEDVHIYGIETIFSAFQSFGNHHFALNSTYAYTVSEDQKTHKQLIYTPYHKATASLSYAWKRISFYTQFLYNGKTYTSPQNEPKNQMPHYFLSNVGLDYDFGKANTYKIGLEILNLTDYQYQSIPGRPMPGRSFQIYANIKF